jgi:hypothetical protein
MGELVEKHLLDWLQLRSQPKVLFVVLKLDWIITSPRSRGLCKSFSESLFFPRKDWWRNTFWIGSSFVSPFSLH